MKDLTDYLDAINASDNVVDAKSNTALMIQYSLATAEKKESSSRQLQEMDSVVAIQTFAYNFALSGEGLKVI
tara:strand:+ start:1118 stop:1333 length:216 start_codon:yes stop_codon:yes gene_type:complete